jgi:uncharacterized membrane protein YfcA
MKIPMFRMASAVRKGFTASNDSTVFNQPVKTEQRYHLARTIYTLSLATLIALAGAIIGLKAMTINFIEDNRESAFEFQTQDPEPVIMAALPRRLYTAPPKLAIIAGGISVFVGIGHLIFVMMDWKTGTKVRIFSLTTSYELTCSDPSVCISP